MLDSDGGRSSSCCGDFKFARSAACQVPASDEFGIVHHPVRTEIIFVSNEAFVQREIGADGILLGHKTRAFVLFVCFPERDKKKTKGHLDK